MKITMKDIARIHGVSVNAVSLALNNKPGVSESVCAQILKTAAETGYLDTKEKFVKTYASTNICVLMQTLYSQDMDFYGQILVSIVDAAKRDGFDTIIHFFNDDVFEVPTVVENGRVSGIIVLGKIRDAHLATLETYAIPVVLADHASLERPVDSIVTNNRLGGYIITRHLIQQGYTKIGFFGELTYSLSIRERYEGYQQALMTHLAADIEDSQDYQQTYSVLAGIEKAVLSNNVHAIRQLIKARPILPQAFVCSNDKAAISLMVTLQALGYEIPKDIAVTGFDNIAISERIQPALTTIDVNKRLMGKRAVQRLLYIIGHKKSLPEQLSIGFQLIERASSVKR